MAETPASGKGEGYIPALDGLRALSIGLVVASHAGLDHVLPGAFGVTLFFFISGYLITRQLLQSLEADGRIKLGNFYLRRALRLLPAVLVYIVAAGALFSLAGGHIPLAGWAAAQFYGANYYDIWEGYRTTLGGVRHPFNILWSLAVEEHFYIVWPFLLALLWRGRATVWALAALCLAVLAWRAWLFTACYHGGAPWVCGPMPPNPLWRFNRLYLATDTRLDSIAFGASLAAVEATGWAPGRRSWAVWLTAALLLTGFALPGPFARQVVRTSLQGIALFVLVPAALVPGKLAARLLSATPLLAVGRLSYSLYLWHWGAFAAADSLAPSHGLAWQAIALPLAAVLAVASYHGIERPMLALRRRAGSHAPITPLSEVPHAAT